MKKILLSFTTLLSLSINAQTLTQANHAPAAGEQFNRIQCDSAGITLGSSGSGQMWNYSTITPHYSIDKNYSASNNTNTNYAPADVMITNNSSGELSFFKSSATDLKYYGGKIIIASYVADLMFSTPAIYAGYPMSLNSASSNTIAGTVSAFGGGITGSFTGNVAYFADGSGTLMLPLKTFTNVLKVTTTQVVNTDLGVAGTATITQLNVDYYAVGEPTKAPVFSISTNTTSSSNGPTTQTLVTILKNYVNIGINETEKEETSVIVYPNPVSSVAHFTSKNNQSYKVSVFDVTGRIVGNTLFDNNVANFNVEGLKTGVYFYTVLNKSNQPIKSGKFSVE